MKHEPTQPIAAIHDRVWDNIWIPLVMAVLGTFSLAYAWKVQTYDLGAATDERMLLQRSQLVVNLWEAKRDQWVIALNQELTKPNPDQLFLARVAAEANKATIMWQGYMKLRIEKSSVERGKILAQRDKLLTGNDALLDQSDTKSLLQVYTANVATFKAFKSLDALDQQFSNIVDEADANANRATSTTSTFYMVGTGLMLLSTIVSSLQLARTLGSLQKSAQFAPRTR